MKHLFRGESYVGFSGFSTTKLAPLLGGVATGWRRGPLGCTGAVSDRVGPVFPTSPALGTFSP